MTLRDIEEIRLIYIKVLNDMYHPRINYPDSNQPANTTIPGESIVVTPVTLEIAALPAPLPVVGQQLAVLSQPTDSQPPINDSRKSNSQELATVGQPSEKRQPITDSEQPDNEKASGKNLKRNVGGIGGAGRSIK